MDPREEDELRNLIRKELESREQLKRKRTQIATAVPEMNEERRRIIEGEIEKFYRSKGGYLRVENEEGEIEWLSEDELKEREQQIPVDMEELEDGQRKVRWRIVAIIVLSFIGLVLLFLLTRERTGSLQVICNVPGATIVLDGSPTEFTTNARLDHMRQGPHLISVTKYGYVADGPPGVQVYVRGGSGSVVTIKLKPGTDTLGRSK
jgi:hypothetical protein